MIIQVFTQKEIMSSIISINYDYQQDNFSTPPSSPTRSPQPKVTPDRRKLLTYPLTDRTRSPYGLTEWYSNAEEQLQKLQTLDSSIIPLEESLNKIDLDDDQFDKTCIIIENKKDEYNKELEKLKNLIEDINQPKDLLVILKLISTRFFQDTEKLFYHVLLKIRKEVQELDHYMIDIRAMEHEGPVLTPNGVSKILEFFHREYNIPNEMLSCCSNTSLKFRLKEMLDQKVEGEFRGWVVHQDSFQEDDKHMVPVFSVFHQGRLHIYIIDSQGHDVHIKHPNMNRLGPCLQSLRNDFANTDKICENVKLYSYQSRRQSGNVECSVFSLLDLKCLIEMHRAGENLVDYFETQVDETFQPKQITPEMLREKTGFPFYELQILPPSLMKPMQSISAFRDLRDKYSTAWSAYNASRFNSLGETVTETQDVEMLYEKVKQCTVLSDEGVSRNLYARNKRFSYIIYLILTILDGPSAGVEELC